MTLMPHQWPSPLTTDQTEHNQHVYSHQDGPIDEGQMSVIFVCSYVLRDNIFFPKFCEHWGLSSRNIIHQVLGILDN